LFFIQLYRWFPSVLKAITIVRPETLVRWHRAGFRQYWRWKSRSLGGRPQIDADLRALIRRMSVDNPLWGAPRIHGELLKLGFEVAQRGRSSADFIIIIAESNFRYRQPHRAIQTGVGPVDVRRAKVRDRGDVGAEEKIRFTSSIPLPSLPERPAYHRRSNLLCPRV
jgi:hypothetical protein